MADLRDKVAIVTGASKGIGETGFGCDPHRGAIRDRATSAHFPGIA